MEKKSIFTPNEIMYTKQTVLTHFLPFKMFLKEKHNKFHMGKKEMKGVNTIAFL